MPALIFDTCCGCIDLRTGCLIIGYLSLVGEIAQIIVTLIAVVRFKQAIDFANRISEDAAIWTNKLVIVDLVFLAIAVIVFFLLLAFTIALLVGVHQHKRGHVKAYLIYGIISMVVLFIAFLGSFGGAYTTKQIVNQVLTLVVNLYFLLVIRSYYYKMDDLPAVGGAANSGRHA